jgi:RNA polymerase sigma factor (sigma-70 family)
VQYLSDLQQYVADIASIPCVSREEAYQLTAYLSAVRQGMFSPDMATQAKQRLIEGHLWLVVSLVKRSPARLCTLSPLDLVQEGTLGLLRAIERFDFAQAGNFTAYAATTIRYAILEALPMEDSIAVSRDLFWRNHTDEGVAALRALQPVSLDAAYVEDGDHLADVTPAPSLVLPDPTTKEEDQQHQAKRAQVEALLARLTPREQQVLRLRYGLDAADGRAHTLTATAQQLSLACSTVCHLERRALQKLRALADPEAEQTDRRQEQVQRLEAACAALEAEGLPVTMARLCSRAHVGSKAAAAFLKDYHPVARPKPRRAVKPARPAKALAQERLATAFAHLSARGEKVTEVRLRQAAGVGTDAAGAFLRAHRAGGARPDLS